MLSSNLERLHQELSIPSYLEPIKIEGRKPPNDSISLPSQSIPHSNFYAVVFAALGLSPSGGEKKPASTFLLA